MVSVSESEVFDALEESYLLNGGGDEFEFRCDGGGLCGERLGASDVRVTKFYLVMGESNDGLREVMMEGLAVFLREYGCVGGEVLFEIPVWESVYEDCEMMEFLRGYGFEYRGSGGRPDAEELLMARGNCGVGGWIES